MNAEDADHAYRTGRRVGRMDWQGACHSGGLNSFQGKRRLYTRLRSLSPSSRVIQWVSEEEFGGLCSEPPSVFRFPKDPALRRFLLFVQSVDPALQEDLWRGKAGRGMQVHSVVERIDLIKDVGSGFGLCVVARALHKRILQAVEEAFRTGVLPEIPSTDHQALHAYSCNYGLKVQLIYCLILCE